MNFNAIDISQFGFDSEYLTAMVLIVLVFGSLSYLVSKNLFREKAVDNKMAAGKISKPGELPKDNRYELMSALGWFVGMGAALYLAPGLIAFATIGAGVGTYVAVAGFLALVLVYVCISVFHTGVRCTLIKAAEYAADAIKAGKDAVDIVAGANDQPKQ